MTEAIQSDRNSGSPNGAQGETEFFAAIGATTGMLIISAILLSSAAPGVPARLPRFRTLRLRSPEAKRASRLVSVDTDGLQNTVHGSGQAREMPVTPPPPARERRLREKRPAR